MGRLELTAVHVEGNATEKPDVSLDEATRRLDAFSKDAFKEV